MDFNQNYFEIFRLPVDFNIDISELSERHRELQKEVHPDRFASGTDQEKRLSMQWSALVNTAHETLRSPLLRGIYMLELRGLRLDHNPQLPAELLMRQIQLREELEEFEESTSALDRLDGFKTRLNRKLEELGQLFALTEYDEAALELVYEMQFLTKLLVAADQLEEKLL
ncbi:MAG: Fe-S protein assembly co-chaperone HscB, partial [Gammaproteobacteria bacterium]|nr:Fe-S protein assembly co-chaperone HscB [Gammaproteobacteria bacterium]